MTVLAAIIPSLLLHNTFIHPGGNEQRRDADAQTRKVKGDVLAIRGFLAVGEGVAGGNVDGRRDVVTETTVFVKSEDEEGFFPLRGGTQGLVDFLDKGLALGDGRGWVEGLIGAAFGIDVCKLGQFAGSGVGVELGEGLDVLSRGAGGNGPLIEKGVGLKAGGVGVVYPRNAFFGELLEDGFHGDIGDVEVVVVAAVAVRSAGGEISTVGVGWAWDGGEPAVKENIVFGHSGEDPDLILGVVVDRLGSTRDIGRLVNRSLFGYEPLHGLWQLACSDCGFIWVESAEELIVDTADAMVWVIRRNVLGNGFRARHPARWVRGVHRVAVGFADETINVLVVGQAASEGVEGSVFLNQDNDVLDVLGDTANIIIVVISSLLVVVVVIGTGGGQGHCRQGEKGGE